MLNDASLDGDCKQGYGRSCKSFKANGANKVNKTGSRRLKHKGFKTNKRAQNNGQNKLKVIQKQVFLSLVQNARCVVRSDASG